MDVRYNKLFKTLVDERMKKTEFAKEVGISQDTLAKLSKNETVFIDIIIKICRMFHCTVGEIIDVVQSPDNGTGSDVE